MHYADYTGVVSEHWVKLRTSKKQIQIFLLFTCLLKGLKKKVRQLYIFTGKEGITLLAFSTKRCVCYMGSQEYYQIWGRDFPGCRISGGAFVTGELHQFMLCQHLMCMQIPQTSFQQLYLSRTPVLGLRNTIQVKEGFEQIIIFIYHLGWLIQHLS